MSEKLCLDDGVRRREFHEKERKKTLIKNRKEKEKKTFNYSGKRIFFDVVSARKFFSLFFWHEVLRKEEIVAMKTT